MKKYSSTSIVIALLTFAINVHAYIDPGTGSYLTQVIIAAVLGGLFSVKIFWQRLRRIGKSVFRRSDSTTPTKNEDEL